MTTKLIVEDWFAKWEKGDYLHLPITDQFRHSSPFGTIDGKQAYLDLVEHNKDKFLGQTFEIHDAMYADAHACVRYTAQQGEEFSLDVSEWYYFHNNLISEIHAYYHIGEIRAERKLSAS